MALEYVSCTVLMCQSIVHINNLSKIDMYKQAQTPCLNFVNGLLIGS